MLGSTVKYSDTANLFKYYTNSTPGNGDMYFWYSAITNLSFSEDGCYFAMYYYVGRHTFNTKYDMV